MVTTLLKRYSELNINQKINAKVDIFYSTKGLNYKHAKLMWAACSNWLIVINN